jgi:hypothetical protein
VPELLYSVIAGQKIVQYSSTAKTPGFAADGSVAHPIKTSYIQPPSGKTPHRRKTPRKRRPPYGLAFLSNSVILNRR